jgi:hypothetical protein
LINLKGYLVNRNYNTNSVDKNINKIHTKRTNKQTKKTARITLIIPYHPTNPPLAKKLHQVWSKHKDSLPKNILKPITAYTRPKNLKEMLTKARYRDNMDMLPPKEKDITKMEKLRRDKYNINFDKNQMRAPINHTQQTCKCG